ncbi:hypothetical protein [Leuconostoc citreum]|uniref:hypothetical protein n=1 Tax=Leuconostoc citreum TaxID=33964 RepID=UPI000BFEE21C|nr:hypothetical protein [Leuconostoc citreum]
MCLYVLIKPLIHGIILAIKSIEDYFTDLGISYDALAQFKVHDLVIKAGKTLKEDLDDVAVNLLVKTIDNGTWSFKGKVGTFSVVVKVNKMADVISKKSTEGICSEVNKLDYFYSVT